MAITVEIGGVTFRCDTDRDLAALVNVLGLRTGSSIAQREARNGRRAEAAPSQGNAALRILEAVHGAGKPGIPSKDLAVLLGLNGPRGLGGLKISETLEETAGLTLSDVVSRRKDEHGVRRWYPKSKILEALEVLRK